MTYSTEILGCTLLLTCYACPEQYDVILNSDGKQIGYLRLRHGTFRATYPDVGGDVVYVANPEGDGIFIDEEREHFLTAAVKACLDRHNEKMLFLGVD